MSIAVVFFLVVSPVWLNYTSSFFGMGISNDPQEAMRQAGWLNITQLSKDRYLFEDILTRTECKAIRMLSSVTMDTAHKLPWFFEIQQDKSSEFDSVGSMVTALISHPEAMEFRQRLLPVFNVLMKTMDNARRVAGSLLKLPYLRFEGSNMMHRWIGPYIQGPQFPFAMGFHLDNCMLDVDHETFARYSINRSLPGKDLEPYCHKRLPQTRFREATAVIFLNDEHGEDIEGGELFFGQTLKDVLRSFDPSTRNEDKEHYTTLRPRCGRVVIFRGDFTNPHAVGKLWRGERWVLQLFMVPGLHHSLPDAHTERNYLNLNLQMYFGHMLLYFQLFTGVTLPWMRMGTYTIRYAIIHLFISFYYPRCSPWLLRTFSPAIVFLASWALFLAIVWNEDDYDLVAIVRIRNWFLYSFGASVALSLQTSLTGVDNWISLLYRFGIAFILFAFYLACFFGHDINEGLPLPTDVTLPPGIPLPANPGLRNLPDL